MSARLVLTSVVLALLAPVASGAQDPEAAIPRDVVRAILRHHDNRREVGILVTDRLPSQLASSISLPPGARLLAILTDGGDTQLIGEVPGGADSVRLWFAQEFERRGYLPIEEVGRMRPVFRPAERSPSDRGYCAGDRLFSASAMRRPAGMVEFVLHIEYDGGCVNRDMHRGSIMQTGIIQRRGTDAPLLPLLYHPRSVEMAERCSPYRNQRSSSASAESGIATSIPPESILEHYARQMDSLGWSREVAAGALGSWTKPDSAGRTVRLLLTIEPSESGGDCRTVRMTGTEIVP